MICPNCGNECNGVTTIVYTNGLRLYRCWNCCDTYNIKSYQEYLNELKEEDK